MEEKLNNPHQLVTGEPGVSRENKTMTKPQVVELVSIIHRRARSTRGFKEECELQSWEPLDAEHIRNATPQVYQERYDEILKGFKKDLLDLANDIIENEFFTCEPLKP